MAPDPLSRHELLDRAYLAQDFVARFILEHPELEANPEWKRLAEVTLKSLFDLFCRWRCV